MQQLEAARCRASASRSNAAKVRDGLNCSGEKEERRVERASERTTDGVGGVFSGGVEKRDRERERERERKKEGKTRRRLVKALDIFTDSLALPPSLFVQHLHLFLKGAA